jgi:hypothetical protein
VCDDYWTDIEAQVACRQLKKCSDDCKGAFATRRNKFENNEEVKYAMDNVNCNGHEMSLFDCSHKTKHNCGQRERAGAICPDYKGPRVRLVHGNEYSGLVELYHDAEWRSVCDDKWDKNSAKVACRGLKLPFDGAIALVGGDFRKGEQVKYWLDDVMCKGDEDSLLSCSNYGTGNHDCGQGQRAGVICKES